MRRCEEVDMRRCEEVDVSRYENTFNSHKSNVCICMTCRTVICGVVDGFMFQSDVSMFWHQGCGCETYGI